jgi:hypothetical protein
MLPGVSKGTRKPARVILYGPAKIGKTSWASQFPKPIFITTEDGAEGLAVDSYEPAESWTEILNRATSVASGDHDYKTVVLDTLNGAAELAAQHVCQTLFNGDWGPKGFAAFGQGVGATSEEMRRLLPILDQCRKYGMTVVLLAHTGLMSVKNPVEGDYQKWAPEMDRRIWARFAKWSDMIGRADYEYLVMKRDGAKEMPGRVKGTSARIVHWTGSAAEDAGTRAGFEMPGTTLLSYQAFADGLGKSESLVDEVKAMWSLLTAEQASKALAWLGGSIDNADPKRLPEMLNRLRTIQAEQSEREEEAAS